MADAINEEVAALRREVATLQRAIQAMQRQLTGVARQNEYLYRLSLTEQRQAGLVKEIDCWALGTTKGGRYVSLFYSNAQYRMASCYEEEWHKLPDFIREQAEQLAPNKNLSTDRERLDAAELHRCPRLTITRYKDVEDDERARWKLDEVVLVNGVPYAREPNEPSRPSVPLNAHASSSAPTAAPPPWQQWQNVAQALAYGVDHQLFADAEAARAAYNDVKARVNPPDAATMFEAYYRHLEQIAATRRA